jgi:hypothetical protein
MTAEDPLAVVDPPVQGRQNGLMTVRETPAILPAALPGSDPAAVEAWTAWRAERDSGLAEEHGWLTLTALHLLTATPQTFDGLPGVWFADTEGVHIQAEAAAGILPADTSAGIEAGTIQRLRNLPAATRGQRHALRRGCRGAYAPMTTDACLSTVVGNDGETYEVRSVRPPRAPLLGVPSARGRAALRGGWVHAAVRHVAGAPGRGWPAALREVARHTDVETAVRRGACSVADRPRSG